MYFPFYIKYIVVVTILILVGLLLDYFFLNVLRNILQEKYKHIFKPRLYLFFFFLFLFFLNNYLCLVL